MLNTLLIMDAAAAAAGLSLLACAISTRKEMRRLDARRVAELAQLYDTMAGMQSQLAELSAEWRERESLPIPNGRRMAINLHPRAQALRMLRHGKDEHTVSATLNLPLADVSLLRKVSQILCAAKEL